MDNNLLKRIINYIGIVIIILFIIATFVFIIGVIPMPSSVKKAEIHYGESQIYSKDDMEQAAKVIKNKFKEFDGCKFKSISYSGDDTSLRESDDSRYDECIVFMCRFEPFIFKQWFGEMQGEQTFIFFLGRNKGGSWEFIKYGSGY